MMEMHSRQSFFALEKKIHAHPFPSFFPSFFLLLLSFLFLLLLFVQPRKGDESHSRKNVIKSTTMSSGWKSTTMSLRRKSTTMSLGRKSTTMSLGDIDNNVLRGYRQQCPYGGNPRQCLRGYRQQCP